MTFAYSLTDATFPYPVTLLVVAIFLLIAVIPPRLPLIVRLILQVAGGLFLYFMLSEAEFMMPMADSMKMSSLFGGDVGTGEFNKYALGVLGPVLGIALSLVVAGVRKLLRKGDEE